MTEPQGRVSNLGMVVTESVPDEVWRRAGVDPADISRVDSASYGDGTGAASDQVHLLTATVRGRGNFRLIRKTFSELTSGPHAEASRRTDHWAFWRRELIAYSVGALPTGGGFRAPRFYGESDGAAYIEYVGEERPTPAAAAAALGRWHDEDDLADHASDYPWLARHQLAQRLAVSELDWSAADFDHRLPDIWARRWNYLNLLDGCPWSIAHGDFSTGNLRLHDGEVVALDWATLGISPVGLDIAHLALSTLDGSLVETYLEGLRSRYDIAAVRLAYDIAVCLVGASRAHWMVSRAIPLPLGYVDFVCAHSSTNGS